MAKKQTNFKTITILLLLLAAVVIGGYVYITYLKNPTFKSLFGDQASSTPATLSLGEAERLLKTATIDLDDVSLGVTLVNGNAEFSAEDTPIKGSVTLGNIIEIQKIGDRVDVLTTMVVDYGGSGNFVYLVLFENKQGELVQKSMILLGDRVKVSEVETANPIKTGVDYLVDVFILDRGENESMAAVPSVPKTINLSVKSGQLSVIEPAAVADPKPVTPPTEAVFCTMDAKMCPDGSYVGRSGPNCEFKCPASDNSMTSQVVLKLNQPYEIGNTTIKVTSVDEDSRCPSDVQCIQAGRVRIGLDMMTGQTYQGELIEVGQTTTNQAETLFITLNSVTPYPISTHKITSGEYRFSFTVKTK